MHQVSIFFGGEGKGLSMIRSACLFFESEVSRNDAYTDNTYLVYIHCSIYVDIEIMK